MLDAAERLTSFTRAAEQCGNGKSQWEPETSGPLNPWRVSPMSGGPPDPDHGSSINRESHKPNIVFAALRRHPGPTSKISKCPPLDGAFWTLLGLLLASRFIWSLSPKQSSSHAVRGPRIARPTSTQHLGAGCSGLFLPSFSARGQDEGNQSWLPARCCSKVTMFPSLLLASPIP